MTYNRDLQEDKERLFDTADQIRQAVRIMGAMLQHTQVNAKACLEAASDPLLLATDLADYLVGKGMPFRKAHHAVGKVVGFAEEAGKLLTELTMADYQKAEPLFGPEVFQCLNLQNAMAQRTMTGAPSPAQIKKQITRWHKILEARRLVD